MMSLKMAFVVLVDEVIAAVCAFFTSRSTLTHALTFGLGVLSCIVTLRIMAAPVAKVAEPEPVTVAAATAEEARPPYLDADAECVARVLYGVREYNLPENAKTAIIEVIMNRVADTACEFRTIDSIEEACEQANQWQGYTSGGTYLLTDYELALKVLNNTSGARTVPEGCFFLVVKQGEVIARTEWDGGNEWRVS